MICGAVIAVLAMFMSHRTREGAELQAQYVALRNFLKDFSRLNEAPPASVVLWNRFLVLAVVFGIAEEVIAQLKVAVPAGRAGPGLRDDLLVGLRRGELRQLAGLLAAERLRLGVLGRRQRDVLVIRRRRWVLRRWWRRWRRWRRRCRLAATARRTGSLHL